MYEVSRANSFRRFVTFFLNLCFYEEYVSHESFEADVQSPNEESVIESVKETLGIEEFNRSKMLWICSTRNVMAPS
jgi:hypothetical protein